MKIKNMKTNHIVNPLGFELGKPHFSYVVCETEAKKQKSAQIIVALDEDCKEIIFDSGVSEEINSVDYELSADLKPRTRYYWKVAVWADNGEFAESDTAWFETAKMDEPWEAKFITPDMDASIQPVFSKKFHLEKEIESARLYISGLGVYEAEMNGKKIGEEYLTPGCNVYDEWVQYNTYDITDYLIPGENLIEVALGDGWYKGRYASREMPQYKYGSEFVLICEMNLRYTDGTEEKLGTDTSWKAKKGKVLSSDIYDGEVYDGTSEDNSIYTVSETAAVAYEALTARYSLPVVVKDIVKPVTLITTPLGEKVLDMGQNMVGWLTFVCREAKGQKIRFQFGEILQEGNFYRDNLRTAKEEFVYISDGKQREIRPHFTFFGFRYVKITGISDIRLDDFTGKVLYSDMEQTGHIKTSHPLVNKLFQNTLWGQRGNFVDIPTDCPQRDERLGWTGDAQIFSGTACFNMDVFQFFKKYGHDIYSEQKKLGGAVPVVVPSKRHRNMTSCAWGEAATVIPWNVYVHYGNRSILEDQFESMKGWVDFMRQEDIKAGGKKLWTTGFHYGDWLALDGGFKNMPTGGTNLAYLASANYYYSATLVVKAARVLGKKEEEEKYQKLADDIRTAIQREYFSPEGKLTIDTQTAYIVALYFGLCKEEWKDRVIEDMRHRFRVDGNYLTTGFIGTPYLGRVLSNNKSNDIAYTLLLNDKFPSWFYEISMGATTIWERWNSVLPDGSISDTGMNSLNHYAYGSIVEWMYRDMAGINPSEEAPGFKMVYIEPKPEQRIHSVKASVDSASGTYESGWTIEENKILYHIVIPFDGRARVTLRDVKPKDVLLNGENFEDFTETGNGIFMELDAGTWEFECEVSESFYKYYSSKDSVHEIMRNEEAKSVLLNKIPKIEEMDSDIYAQTPAELSLNPFYLGIGPVPITEELLKELDDELGKIRK
jgi:alpha-L-rhamnosidase